MIWAFLGALLIGLSLGLMGSGGSIFTVPVLTFIVGQDEKVAIAGSLGIVGAISLVAAIPYARRRLIDVRSVLYFGLPGMLGAYLGASLSRFVSGEVQLAVFTGLMVIAGVFMLRSPVNRNEKPVANATRSAWRIIIDGLVVGIITGFVGVGGGFMIVPALVLLGGLEMQKAIGTSLLIIALKSFAGFVKYLDVLDDLGLELDHSILATFTGLGILGSFAGRFLGASLSQETLRRVFAIFLFIVALLITLQSLQSAPT